MTPSTHPPSPFKFNSGNPQNVQNEESDKNPASQSASDIYDSTPDDGFDDRNDAHVRVGQPGVQQSTAPRQATAPKIPLTQL